MLSRRAGSSFAGLMIVPACGLARCFSIGPWHRSQVIDSAANAGDLYWLSVPGTFKADPEWQKTQPSPTGRVKSGSANFRNRARDRRLGGSDRGATLQAMAHHFHGAYERGHFPVALGAETVTIGHQTLHCNSRELCETMQVFK